MPATIFFLLLHFVFYFQNYCLVGSWILPAGMDKHSIVPDVIKKLPKTVLKVTYNSGATVDQGNELTPTQVKDEPKVEWEADPNKFYLLCKTDPDAPSRKEPKFREWQHWLVGNIPGSDVSKGEVLSEFVGAAPPKGSGLHRYVFLVYEQPSKLKFDEPRLKKTSGKNRGSTSIQKLANKYKLGDPVAANLYQAQWDDYCPILYKQLKG